MKARLSEKTLITIVKTRTRTGAEALYDQYATSLFKIIYCYVKDPQLAEDLLEQTFIKIWNSIDMYEDQPGGLHAWMLSIARSLSKSATTTTVHSFQVKLTKTTKSFQPKLNQSR
jgi:DNA-directed RNA polymerase specialized sigma24 family protein